MNWDLAPSFWGVDFVCVFVPQTGLPVRGSYSFETVACPGRLCGLLHKRTNCLGSTLVYFLFFFSKHLRDLGSSSLGWEATSDFMSSEVTTYLLESSRVVVHARRERTYHCFYAAGCFFFKTKCEGKDSEVGESSSPRS